MHLNIRPLSALLLIFSLFLLVACGEAATDTGGTPNTDNSQEPQPTEPLRTPGPHRSNQSMIDPQRVDYFDFYNRVRPLPFYGLALTKLEIREMEVRQYTVNENEDLTEESTEEGLIPAKVMRYSFRPDGKVARFEQRLNIVGDPADSTFLTYRYRDDGQALSIAIEEEPESSKATYMYNADGSFLERYLDPEGLSVKYSMDESRGWRYETHYDKEGGGTVFVFGPEADFPDSTCFRVQEEILSRLSPHVEYGLAPELREVIFLGLDERRPVYIKEMTELRTFRGKFDYTYASDEALGKIEFSDGDRNGARTEKRFTYNEFGDLSRVTFNENNPEGSNLTIVQHFEYDSEGRWIKRVRFRKLGGKTKLERIDFVSYPE